MTIDATQFVAYITLTPYQRDFFADYVVIYAADRAMVEAAIAYARKAPAGPGAPETTPATTVGTGIGEKVAAGMEEENESRMGRSY